MRPLLRRMHGTNPPAGTSGCASVPCGRHSSPVAERRLSSRLLRWPPVLCATKQPPSPSHASVTRWNSGRSRSSRSVAGVRARTRASAASRRPLSLCRQGRTNRWKQTSVLTGLPARGTRMATGALGVARRTPHSELARAALGAWMHAAEAGSCMHVVQQRQGWRRAWEAEEEDAAAVGGCREGGKGERLAGLHEDAAKVHLAEALEHRLDKVGVPHGHTARGDDHVRARLQSLLDGSVQQPLLHGRGTALNGQPRVPTGRASRRPAGAGGGPAAERGAAACSHACGWACAADAPRPSRCRGP